MFFDEITKREACGSHGGHSHGHSHSHGGGIEEETALMGLRISSVFVILIGSGFGAFFPILASRYSFIRMPKWVFFICKYFGSGVIISTAFIHLLHHANISLSSECLSEEWQSYPFAFAILLVTLFLLLLSEILAYKYVEKKLAGMHGNTHSHFGEESAYVKQIEEDSDNGKISDVDVSEKNPNDFVRASDYQDKESLEVPMDKESKEKYFGQLVSIFVLEFGVLFHSVFVGLTLGITEDEFTTLYIVIIFHQLFEGLGLGSRIAATMWPKGKRWTPWALAAGFTLVTPIAIAIGLAVRETYPSSSPRALITNGVFDSISAGILVYTGLVELMAREFLFSDEFKGPGSTKRMLLAFGVMCLGCGMMSLLGKWA